MPPAPFHFKKFSIDQDGAAHAVGTDGVLLGAWADPVGAQRILDIGAGTGLIALMLAQRADESAMITAVEVHLPSVQCAFKNVRNSAWNEKISIHEADFQVFSAKEIQPFDLIVSNPPYFTELTLSPDAARSQSRSVGALPFEALLGGVGRLLAQNGRFCVVLPEKEGRLFCELAVLHRLYCTKEVRVLSSAGKPVERVLLQLERDPGRFERSELVIYEKKGGYTAAYWAIVAPYYLDK